MHACKFETSVVSGCRVLAISGDFEGLQIANFREFWADQRKNPRPVIIDTQQIECVDRLAFTTLLKVKALIERHHQPCVIASGMAFDSFICPLGLEQVIKPSHTVDRAVARAQALVLAPGS